MIDVAANAVMSLPPPTLRTARLRLRPFTAADTDAIFALQSNPRVLRYWDAPPWRERAQAERFIVRCQQMAQEGSGARLAIERSADDRFIGWCTLMNWDSTYRSALLGYCAEVVGAAIPSDGGLRQWAGPKD